MPTLFFMPKIKYLPCKGWVVVVNHKIVAQAHTKKQAEVLAAQLESAKSP